MKRLLLITTLLFASLAAASGVYHDRDTDSRGVFQVIAKAPAKARDRKNPYDGQPDAVSAGEKLFLQHCAECHGEEAQGRGRAANLRLAGVQNATPGELAWFLRSGNLVRGMPPWAGIPEQRRWQIVAYLKSLGVAPKSNTTKAGAPARHEEAEQIRRNPSTLCEGQKKFRAGRFNLGADVVDLHERRHGALKEVTEPCHLLLKLLEALTRFSRWQVQGGLRLNDH